MNLPRAVGKRLAAYGHECRHVGEIGMAKSNDIAIMAEAKASNEVILTHDLDYGNLLAFSGDAAPVCSDNTHPQHPPR